MKFALVASFAAFAVSFVMASPTVAEGSNLEARTFCTGGQFWYQPRSCCLDKGGPKTPPPTPAGKDCPNNWYWHGKQSCCVPRDKPPTNNNPPEPECVPKGGKKWKWSRGGQCCEPGGNTPEPPKPSQNPFGNNYGFNFGYHNKREEAPVVKRHSAKAKAIAGRRVMTCPSDYVACPIDGSVTSGDWECVSPTEDITSCGGCSSTGEGQDCTAIAHSWNVSCDIGSCKVLSCIGGYKVAADGKSCVAL